MRRIDRNTVHIIAATVIAVICVGIGCKPRKNSASVKETKNGSFTPLVGGACSASGQFTQDALRQAHVVREKLQAFMEDKNCSAVTSAIASLPDGNPNESINAEDMSGMNLFAMSQEVQALRRIHSIPHSYKGSDGQGVTQSQMTGLLNQRLFQMIGVEQSGIQEKEGDGESSAIQRARNDVNLAMNQKKRVLQTASAAIDALGNMFDGLASSAACPINQPGPLGAVATASVKLLGAYAGADTGLAMKASATLQKYLNWSQKSYFRNALSSMDQAELGLTISCLLETSANSYCSIRDNQALQKDVVAQDPNAIDHLMGYKILSKEAPILANWLIQLKSSQPSRKTGDVADQIANMMTPVNIQQKRFQISSLLAKAKFNMDKDPQTGRQQVFQVMSDISNLLGGPIAEGLPAFFDLKYPYQFRYFYLLKIPVDEQCTRAVNPKDQDSFFVTTNYMSIGEPEVALNTIQNTVNEMFTTISGQVSNYLRRNSNQDAAQVIAAFETPVSAVQPSPRQVMIDIQNYMMDVLAIIDAEAKNNIAEAAARQPLAAVIVESVKKIDRILKVSDQIRTDSSAIFQPGGAVDEVLNQPRRTSLALGGAVPPPPLSEAEKRLLKLNQPLTKNPKSSIADLKKADDEREKLSDADIAKSKFAKVFETFRLLGSTVVTEFDMDTYQEMFIINRLARVVQFDMQRLMRTMMASPGDASFSPVTQALLAVANDMMVDRLGTVFGTDPQRMKIDLASAQVVNINTMEALGSATTDQLNTFGSSNPVVNTFLRYIGILTARTVGGARTPAEISKYIGDTLSKDSINDAFLASISQSATKAVVMPVKIWANVVNQIEFTSKLSWNDALQAGVSATPDKWTSSSNTIGRWMRPDLYWTPNWWSGNRLFTDNEAGSMATLRATFCIQTLSMPDPRMFNAFCKGAVLYSVFETSEAVEARAKAGSSVTLGADGTMAKVQGLSLVYDDWFRAYEMNEQKHLPKNKNYFQSQRVCALYDHFRANEVFFLTKPQRDIELINEARNRK